MIGHVGKMVSGAIRTGDRVTLSVDEDRRNLTANNHSATHLMQKALRIVLGNHVEQAGSLVDKDKLRFDFTHFSPMTDEEIGRVEEIVNQEIAKGLSVITSEMTLEDAKKKYVGENPRILALPLTFKKSAVHLMMKDEVYNG